MYFNTNLVGTLDRDTSEERRHDAHDLSAFPMTEGYRSARNATTKVCFAGMLWSFGAFQSDTVSLGALGEIDLSSALVRFLLAIGIVYSAVFLVLEFSMQPTEARQMRLAQTDFNITSSLAQWALLMLATSGMYRSSEAALYVAALLALLGVTAGVVFLVIFFALVPIMIRICGRQGRYSVLARLLEAEGWAVLIVLGLQLVLFPFICKALVDHPLLEHLWETPPSLFDSYFMGSTVSFLLFSVSAKRLFKGNLFDAESRFRWYP